MLGPASERATAAALCTHGHDNAVWHFLHELLGETDDRDPEVAASRRLASWIRLISDIFSVPARLATIVHVCSVQLKKLNAHLGDWWCCPLLCRKALSSSALVWSVKSRRNKLKQCSTFAAGTSHGSELSHHPV